LSGVLTILLSRPILMPRVYLVTQHDKNESSINSSFVFCVISYLQQGFSLSCEHSLGLDSSNSILAADYLSILQTRL